MSLRWKLVLFFSFVFALFILMAQAVMRNTVMPGFQRLEQREAIKDVQRCTDAMSREVHSLSIFLLTWAAWDDAYQYMDDHNSAFIKSNCPPETYTNNNLNLIWLVQPNGKLVWGETRDDHTGNLIDFTDLNPGMLNAQHPLVKFTGMRDMTGGVIVTSRGPMLIVARPIVTSHNEGPIRGSLIMGRLFVQDEMQQLNQQTHVTLQAWPARPNDVPAADRAFLNTAHPGETQLVEKSDQLLYAYSIVNDIYGKPALLLRADIPRDITINGLQSARAALYLNMIGAGAILLTLWLLTQFVVVRPLQTMSRHMVAMGARDDLKGRLNSRRSDEIGLLADQFDLMVASLAESRARLIDAAHRTGMLDIATDVLHNVGNAINTVNISAGVLHQRLRDSKLPGLSKAAAMLAEHRDDLASFLVTDMRGAKLTQYLSDLSQALLSERAESLADLQRLLEKVHHIRDIISTQLEYASNATFAETEEFTSVLDAVLRMNAEAIEERKIKVTIDAAGAATIPMNKAKFMQVLNNLVQNAIDAAPPQGGQLTVRTWQDQQWMHIEVADSGHGIESAQLPSLFTHGFTTKPRGHGFGLHYCANAVREVGGKIRACSDGAGRGATFIIELPLVGTLDLNNEERDERQVA